MRSANRNRGLVILLAIAILLRVILFVAIRPWDEGIVEKKILIHDSYIYNNLALEIYNGSISSFTHTKLTPGYPVFVYLIYLATGYRPWVVIAVQLLLNIMTIALVYELALALFGEKASLPAAVLYSLAPLGIYFSFVLVTETLFLLLLVAAVIMVVRALKSRRYVHFGLSAFLFGLASLVKPIAQYTPFVVVATIILYSGMRWSRRMKSVIVFAAVFILAISPWLLRNYMLHDNLSLSTIKGRNLFFFNVAYMEMLKTGKDLNEVRLELLDRVEKESWYVQSDNPFVKSKMYDRYATGYIRNNLVDYGKLHFKGIFNCFASIGGGNLCNIIGVKSGNRNFGNPLFKSNAFMLLSYFKNFANKNGYEIIISISALIVVAVTYLSFVVGLLNGIAARRFFDLMLPFLLVVYFSVLVGPVGGSRYKLPMVPFYTVIAGLGLYKLARGINKIRIRGKQLRGKDS